MEEGGRMEEEGWRRREGGWRRREGGGGREEEGGRKGEAENGEVVGIFSCSYHTRGKTNEFGKKNSNNKQLRLLTFTFTFPWQLYSPNCVTSYALRCVLIDSSTLLQG